MRDLRVRTKLLVVLTIPVLGFLAVTGFQVASTVRAATELDSFSRQVALGREINTLVHELQRERDRTVGVLAAIAATDRDASPTRNLGDLSPDRTAVDRAAAGLDAAAQPLRRDTTFDRAYRTAAAGLADIARARDGVQSGWLRDKAAFDAYTRVIADLHALLLVPARVGAEAALGPAVQALVNISRAKELTAQIRGLLYAVCSSGGFSPEGYEAVADVRAQQQAAIERFRTEASPAQVTAYDEAVSGQAVRNANRLAQTVVENAEVAQPGVDPQQWWQASTTQLELMRGAEQQLLETAIAAAEARSAAQRQTSQLVTAGTLLLLLVALFASLLVGRTMVRSLTSLREQALDVAQRRLPEVLDRLSAAPKGASAISVDPVAVRSADEVGEVAEAFTAVHRSAVRLATEQALMRNNVNAIYVNLARRSQTLVERQLQLLDTLQSSEADPDQLANLFRLDHLATRMRRNDDNLLVLAGGDGARRWTEPVPLTAVVLAAAAEIEHYTRVRYDISDNIHVVGHVVADLVHLVAELLENATIFSPPDTTVIVYGWTDEGGAGRMVIQDHGIGMSAAAVLRANRQVAGPVSIDVATAERMGLVVVGHLAHRHGIRVELHCEGRGVAVTVALPAGLLAAEPDGRLASFAAEPDGRLASFAAEPDGRLASFAAEPDGRLASLADVPAPSRPSTAGAAEWLRTERETAAAVGASVSGGRTAPPRPAGRREIPTRAEDVLGAGRVDTASIWWSRRPGAAAHSAASPRPATATTTSAGLPQRVPMAQLPSARVPSELVPTARGETVPVPPAGEVDPREVGTMLARFYGGVHQAMAEDDDQVLSNVPLADLAESDGSQVTEEEGSACQSAN
jgi:signal transduction histidine kinase